MKLVYIIFLTLLLVACKNAEKQSVEISTPKTVQLESPVLVPAITENKTEPSPVASQAEAVHEKIVVSAGSAMTMIIILGLCAVSVFYFIIKHATKR